MTATANGRVVLGQLESFGVPPFDGYPYRPASSKQDRRPGHRWRSRLKAIAASHHPQRLRSWTISPDGARTTMRPHASVQSCASSASNENPSSAAVRDQYNPSWCHR